MAMVFPVVRWRLPVYGAVKVNVHGFFSEDPLPNGSRSGIRVVIRNHRGKILRLLGSSLGIEEERTNELYAMLQGLIRVHLDQHDYLELETDNVGAFWECDNLLLNGVPVEHEFVTRKLNTRKVDDNLVLAVRPIDESSNELARYLARYGAAHYDRMVIFTNLFGRVKEIWSHDLGLGPVGDQFDAVYEDDLEAAVSNDDVEVLEVEEGEAVN